MKPLILFFMLLLQTAAENLAINELPGMVTFNPPTSDGLPMVATSGVSVRQLAAAVCATVGMDVHSYEADRRILQPYRSYWTSEDGSTFRKEKNARYEMLLTFLDGVTCG
jgi:hypothetical protein